MKKAIFWDFHNTLAYTRQSSLWTRTVFETIAAQGVAVDYEMVQQFVKRSVCPWDFPDEDWTATVGDAFWPYVFTRFDALLREVGFTGDTAPLNAAVRAKIINPDSYELYDDTISTLKACEKLGFSNHILSNNYPEMEAVVTALGIREFFGEVIVSGVVGYDKPRRELFELARSAAGEPELCVMVGDNPTADIQGGNDAGMTTILVHNDAECGANFVCATLSEVPNVLRTLTQEH